MQGLAFAGGKPLLGVSALDALASLPEGRGAAAVAAWIDAWRGEVYAALYEHGREIEAPSVEHPAAILDRVMGPHGSRPTMFLGDGAATFAELIRQRGGQLFDPPAPLLAGAIAGIAHQRAAGGERPRPDDIRPLYVRRTDAELARDARRHS
jgi:tRNA threonylcarbamoyladenosine biosynthesis protein TsaB